MCLCVAFPLRQRHHLPLLPVSSPPHWCQEKKLHPSEPVSSLWPGWIFNDGTELDLMDTTRKTTGSGIIIFLKLFGIFPLETCQVLHSFFFYYVHIYTFRHCLNSFSGISLFESLSQNKRLEIIITELNMHAIINRVKGQVGTIYWHLVVEMSLTCVNIYTTPIPSE